jgi:hypothetical protein
MAMHYINCGTSAEQQKRQNKKGQKASQGQETKPAEIVRLLLINSSTPAQPATTPSTATSIWVTGALHRPLRLPIKSTAAPAPTPWL